MKWTSLLLFFIAVIISGCSSGQWQTEEKGPFEIECKLPSFDTTELCKSATQCAENEGMFSGCDYYCANSINSHENWEVKSARGFERDNKIYCECTCTRKYYEK